MAVRDNKKTKPHFLGHRMRLTSRIVSAKPGAIPDYELLEFLLFYSHLRRDVKGLAKVLIRTFDGFHNVFGAQVSELKQVDGINDSAIAIIKVIKESSKLMLSPTITKKPVLDSWSAVLDYLRVAIGSSSTENFCVLFLDKKFRLIESEIQDYGTLDQIAVYTREIVKKALSVGAFGVLISHNHPSQECKPSHADIRLTERLQCAFSAVGIDLIDHVIVTFDDHFSFASNGLL